MGPERVDDRRARIWQQDHVRLVDLLESSDRGTVEAEALGEDFLGQLVDRSREVLHHPGQVTEANVDDLHALLLRVADHLCRTAVVHSVVTLL